ncbi:iron-siderophore ABC transporter substrate-binding protein [Actinotalea sp. M2MS4P-6]|nr:iron-siderophore ABC transporter substrate-binding protein [Actinotalea sp. M2MS4P-6]
MRRVLRARALLVAATAASLTLAGCAAGDDGATSGDTGSSTGTSADTEADSAGDAFPVTITDAFGETTIDAAPQRVVTWGWGSTDAAIALGVVPVAMPYQGYGGDADGVLPWVREAVDELGAELPTVLPDSGDDVPYEAISAADPDLVLAPYSGLTQEQYDTLSAIAPVVAYPDQPWATPWRDIVTITGEALGRTAEAEQVLTGIDEQIATAAAAHPEFQGKTLAAVWDVGTTFYVYSDADPRVEFMLDLGFDPAPSVTALDTDESTFYFTLSYERLDELTSDVLVAYADSDESLQSFLDAPYAQVMGQVSDGAVAGLVGTSLIASVSPPTALSLPWGLDDTVDALAKAAAAAG